MAFPIQIDTTQLAYGHFRIPTVTGEQAVDGKTVPTLQLEAGSYPLSLDAAGQSVVFSVTPQGTVEYDQKYDRCLAGRGTAKLTVVGFDVTLDARPLNNSGVFFVGLPQESRERFTHKTLRLPPGTYRLQQRGGVVAAFQFTLDLDGTFRYDPPSDTSNGGFLSGTGTTTLQLLGYPIQIDATQLSYPRFLLTGITPTPLDGKTLQTLQLLPDSYNFQQGDFSFDVTPQGRIDFDPGLDNFLSGRGISTLTLSGFPVTLDGQRFPRGILLIAIAAFIKRETVRLLPGTYFVQQTGGVVADFTFTLARDGTFAYDPAFDTGSGGFLAGRGTPTLEFVGYPILLDARDYQGMSLLVHGVTLANSTPEPHPLVLLPHAEVALTLRTDPPKEAKFAVGRDGAVAFKENYPFLELRQQGGQTVMIVKKPARLFTVSGRVRHPDLQPLAGGAVRALDITAGQGLTLAEATTDAEGRYAMSYSSEQLRPVQKAQADLQVVVLGGDGQELARSPVHFKAPPEATVDLTIGAPGEPAAFIVRGVIRQETGAPMTGATVRAFDRDLPSLQPNEELLGETTTDAAGLYQITYTPDQLLHAEANSADLEVRVFNPEGAVLAASPIYFNAPPEATIDVMVTLPEQPPSELEQLLAQLEPVLGGVQPAALTDEDIAFLVGDTGLEQPRLELLRTADQLAQNTGLPTAVFYGFGRQSLPLDLPDLLDLDSATLRQALEDAVAAHIIPAAVRDALDQVMARLDQLRDAELLPVTRQARVQLLNQDTSTPLAGYAVHLHDLDAGPDPVDLGSSITNPQGLVTATYTVMHRRGDPDGAADEPPRRLRLVIMTPENQEIHRLEVAVDSSQPQPLQVRVPVPPAPEFPTHVLPELSKTLQHDLPSGLLDVLATQGIRTLEDVRRAGGLSQVQGLPVPATDPSVRWLESHANLTLLSPDVQVNERLITQGYPSMAAVAETPRADFVNTMQKPLGNSQATRMHVVAQAQTSYLNNLLTTARVEQANGYPAPAEAPALRANGLPETTAATTFGCKDCLSAVSPLAYLADLLDYAVDHLRYQGKRIDLNWLTTTFHQPFAQLPAACKTMTSQVRQVRLSVEVLREYLKSFTPTEGQTKALLTAEREYLLAAYTTLLNQIGTSFEELRFTRAAQNGTGAPTQQCRALAERLGITPEKLDALLLSGVVVTTLHNTTPAPIATLEKDLKALFTSLQVPKDISLSGIPQPEIVVGQLTAEALEILFGLESTHTRNLSGERPASKLRQWRQEYLRTLWFAQDHPSDPYLEEPAGEWLEANLLPAIDPDVIGPDDLRLPLNAEGQPAVDTSPALAVWRDRRQQVDRQLQQLRNAWEVAEQQGQDPFTVLWQETYTSPMPDLAPLLTALTAGTSAEKAQAEVQVQSFHLSVESFTRLATLHVRDQLARRQPAQADLLTAEDRADVYSILTQVWKVRQFPVWRKQESEQAIILGGELFWLSLSEPVEGHWPPALPAQHPLIDPERTKLAELPDPMIGGSAHRLWHSRQTELQQVRKTLQETYRSGGFDALLLEAFGQVPDLAKLQNDLSGSDPQVVERAKTVITTELHLTVEGFLRLMTIKIKPAPTAAELAEVYSLLVTAHKEKARYSTWLAEEQQAGLNADLYWLARKAKLPRWRAGVEGRQRWRQALQARHQPPLIDPDLVDGGYFAKPKAQNPAYQLRRARRAWRETRLQSLRNGRRDAGRNLLPWFDATLISTLGVPAGTLLALIEERDQGHPIAARLEQLTLPPNAFETLLRVRAILAEGGAVLDPEWEDVDSILVQVQKRRAFAAWRTEERRQRIILCADFFKQPESPPLRFSSPQPTWLPEWRASWLGRRDWGERLRSRMDQDQAIPQALQEAVSATEASTLPALRDALVASTDVDAKWLSERLLIDLRNGEEQLTTRISQAIETIQGLLWSARTAQLRDVYPSLELVADDFDEEWQWLGSYATWRAAMLVFLYPENVLAPNLKRRKTPAFRALLERSDRLTPEAASRVAKDYALYVRDLNTLNRWPPPRIRVPGEPRKPVMARDRVAVCYANTLMTNTASGEELGESVYRRLYYVFARVGSTVYWSAYDPRERSNYKQHPWEKVPGLDGVSVTNIVGATPFRGYVYLFLHVSGRGTNKLSFVRFDATQAEDMQARWERELHELPLPTNYVDNAIGIVYEQRRSPQPPQLVFQRIIEPDAGPGYQLGLRVRSMNAEGTGWLSNNGEQQIALRENAFQPIWYSDPDQLRVFAVLDTISGNKVVLCQLGPRLYLMHFSSEWKRLSSAELERDPFIWMGAEYVTSGSSPKVHIFYKHIKTGEVRQRVFDIRVGNVLGTIYTSKQDYLDQILTSSGYAELSRKHTLWQASFQYNGVLYHIYRHGPYQVDTNQLRYTGSLEIVPWTTLETLTSEIQDRRKYREAIQQIVVRNDGESRHDIDEAYFLAPLHIALRLQANGQYTAALDWFRLIYDYGEPTWNRKVYYGLKLEESLTVDYQRQMDWLLDPLDPHAIAATRRNTYSRHTLLSLIRCLLDYADAEFARDTAESLPRARTLYTTALELLDSTELKQNLSGPGEIIGALKVDLSHAPELLADWYDIRADLYRIEDRHLLQDTVNQVSEILDRASEPLEERLVKAQGVVTAALANVSAPAPSPDLAALLSEHRERQHQAYTALLTQPGVVEATTQVGANAGQIVTEVVERRYGGRTVASFAFCVPPNPVVESLRLRAELNLYKLRTGRNIAGIERQLEPYAVAVDTESGLPIIGNGGQLALPGSLALSPTSYRYAVLIERAKQVVQLAAPIESAMLSALEKRDAELYNILKARQDIRLSQANVQLQDLRVTEAKSGETLAGLQRDRAQLQADHYLALRNVGRTGHEQAVLDYMNDAVKRYARVADLATVATVGGGISGAASGAQQGSQIGALAGPVGSVVGGILGGILGGASGAASGLGAKHSARAAQAATRAQIAATEASYERREEEWLFQQNLAQHDVTIGAQQITLAQDRTRIVGQEREIAGIQAEHAEDVLNFLSTKFTDAELYDWMSGVLEGVYRFFLQQATAMAQLAAHQLAFERQETPPSFIQSDYWESPTAGRTADAVSNGRTPDRHGLTGSARLLQDIYQLDQYAFETDKRKLQLVKTVSLSRLDPYAFQRFRETGVLPFTTPMELFDRDFPGHYLRLIKRVRTSVVALIPPIEGIHATLSTTGLSRAVIGAHTFQSAVVKRDPETVALSSPLNASGLFELDPQPDMLYPFEGMGVDTLWEFRLPKAANRFDYRSIADVLITIEYTALNSFHYRQQALQTLEPTVSGDRPFSFRNELADQWYDLHNPDQAATPLTVRFTTVREDFPPNLNDLRLEHVILYFARASDTEPEIQVSGLYFTEQGSAGKVGGAATSIDGVISTRRGNATSWTAMIGKSPFGEWELSLPDNSQIRELFAQEKLEDILLVMTFSGRTPDWPV